VDHSNGSFSSSGSVTSQSIDFGYVPQGFANRSATFAIANLVATPSFTADLALPSITSTGDTAPLSTNASTFTHLAAGASNTYSASLDTSAAGNFAANHTFNVADEAIPGGASGTPLALNMTARVISSASFPVSGFIPLPPA
jgi:hypothetical protein